MLIWATQLASTWFMVGLIWLIQLVHYPLFKHVGEQGFRQYHLLHNQAITPIVLPVMLIELVGAIWMVASPPMQIPSPWLWIALGLVGVCWAATAFASVPAHSLLAAGWDADAHRTLVLTNWIRTVAWSLRGCLMMWLFMRAVST